MLHFFRKIRRDLLANSQFFKYLKYAIGEILLVIIGILVALYINEWNKTRSDIQFEKVILTGIQKDLQEEVAVLNDWNEYTRERIKKISILDSLLKEEMPVYHKSLDTLFGAAYRLHWYKTDNKAKYENLKSRGLNTIQVDSIKEQLIYVFEDIYPGLDGSGDIEMFQNENLYLPYYVKYFRDISWGISATPLDFESVWKDNLYQNIVSIRLKTLKNLNVFNQSSIQEMKKLQRMIDQYLDEENSKGKG